ncbi:hypothetical protein [Owenweeksia hongkongensis]|uniref:hypothetical protein n=1 Tax=Owenweeksia hongkongensis TaxID=253245 RepID=UPI003A8CF2DA
MTNWDTYQFSRDLSDFIALIRQYDIPVDTVELGNLDSQLQYLEGDFRICIENMQFKIDKKISGTMPSDIGRLEILFSHACQIDPSLDENNNDPISDYNFQLCIKGFGEKEYVNWWHLDKNIPSAQPKFTHPYYHFQAGGDMIEGLDCGGLVLLNAPRIPHPPMDLFLGFHFIMNNFYSSKDYTFVKSLLADNKYQEIIGRSQKRMWEKYFLAFSSDSHNHFTRQNVFPLFIN